MEHTRAGHRGAQPRQGELAANQAKAAALGEQIKPLQEQIDQAQAKVAALSAHEYKAGRAGALNVLLETKSATSFTDRLTRLEAMAHKQKAALADVIALKAKYDALKQPLDQLVAKLAAQEADLAKRKAQIDADIKRLNDMRLAAYGQTGGTGALRPATCRRRIPAARRPSRPVRRAHRSASRTCSGPAGPTRSTAPA